uniref:Uncharacterized protein n=1 Tax=Lepeophtheirus salmonis TaxID=72036 RepID=A0A0K2TZT3_LEPSM
MLFQNFRCIQVSLSMIKKVVRSLQGQVEELTY